MNYEEDLTAPVWDELNAETSAPVNEINATLSNLSTNETLPADAEQDNASHDTINTPEPSKSHANELISGGDDSKDRDLDTSRHLLKELAPKNDPLSDLNLSVTAEPTESSIENADDPLFTGSTYLPILSGNDDLVSNTEIRNDTSQTATASQRKATKPQRLFNSARVRRRPLSTVGDKNDKPGDRDQISDPLGESQKDNEFTDEPLDDSPSNSNLPSTKSKIVDLVDEPLFKLSPRKKSDTTPAPKGFPDMGETVEEQTTNEASNKQEELKTFEIEVKDPVKVGELTSTYVEYSVISKSELLENTCAQVSRRYTDFRWLYRQLQSNHWGTIIPPPPEKQSVGRFEHDFVENRRFQMERMLRKIAESPVLQKDADFLMFLSSTNFAIDSKTREHITGSAASSDSNDLSEIHISDIQLFGPEDAALILKKGGIDAESQKRFMNISFSSTPKYVEADDFFKHHWSNAQVLEEQLKQLDKSLGLVDSERNELASVTEEFSKTIESLADLEITKTNADVLSKFAETQRRIKESLQRNSLQESLTLGVTLDEYVRSLSSFKAVFNQRAKLGHYLAIVEADLIKKEAQLEKLHNLFKTQPNSEKVQNAKKEYQTLKNRFNNIKKNWQIVGNRVKDEVENYHAEKIQDFRNSIEVFLESAIESQKENIELWETFYQSYL